MDDLFAQLGDVGAPTASVNLGVAAATPTPAALVGDGLLPVIEMSVCVDGRPAQTVLGRFAWCLAELIRAGDVGVTPLERPAPRWSHYVWSLRTKQGFCIESIEEAHGGAYSGRHVRYRLASRVVVLEVVRGHKRPSKTEARHAV